MLLFSFYSPVYEMLKKYLVVLGCSGKWRIHFMLYTFSMWNVSVGGIIRQQAIYDYSLCS